MGSKSRQWDTAGMQRALADPASLQPLRLAPTTDEFEIDEREHVDQTQAAALREAEDPQLTVSLESVILNGEDEDAT